jgi:hypothetical protein
MLEDDYQGQDLISIGIRLGNFGGQIIEIKPDNVYLEQNGKRVDALAFIPESAVDPNPLKLPVSILPGGAEVGEIYFTDQNELEVLQGWLLVINLTDQDLGIAQFKIPVE